MRSITSKPWFLLLAVVAALLLTSQHGGDSVHAQPAEFEVTRADDPPPNGCLKTDCSLREAVIAANEVDKALIHFSVGLSAVDLSRQGAGEDAAQTGDLDIISGQVTIKGNDELELTIEANKDMDESLFEVHGGASASFFGLVFGVQAATQQVRGPATPGISGAASVNSGGAITNRGTVILEDVTIRGFTVQAEGGAIKNFEGDLTIVNSTISGNTARGFPAGGGAISNAAGSVTIVNSTISGNMARNNGGGIANDGAGTVNLSNVTITGNSADAEGTGFGDGGGIANLSGTINVKNSIIAGNSDPSSAPDCSGTINSGGNNLIEDAAGCAGTTATDIIGQDPQLGPPEDNGGPTNTHALLPGSPAVDAGNPAGCADRDGAPITTDQRGEPRPHGPACDIGAFELGVPPPTPSPTPTPTGTPPAGQTVIWADNNCKDGVSPVDSLLALRFDAGLSANTNECPALGADIDVLFASPHMWGNVDCKDGVSPVDALKILRFDAGLDVSQEAGCPAMGSEVTLIPQ